MRRREFLAGLAGLGAAAITGCGRRNASDESVVFRGWAYEPDLVRTNVERFASLYPGRPVDYEAVSGNYHDKMVALFVAGTPLDCCYVRDDNFAEWVQAGWLQPIDTFPGAMANQADIFPFNWDAMTYDGRLYGLPYYSDFTIFVYNQQMLHQAGLESAARTLDELTEQAIRIKEKRITGPAGQVIEYPFTFALKQSPTGFNDFWALHFASEAELFDPEYEPLFPDDPGRRSERILQWLVDGLHRHRIIDMNSLALAGDVVRDNMAAGRQAFISLSKYDLERLNNPTKSAIAGHAKMALYPSLEADLNGTLGWTRMYCLTRSCRYPERSWELLQYLGGKDPSGDYVTARAWYLQKGLGFAYRSLMYDREIVDSTNRWGDMALIREQSRWARAREIIKAPWYPDFDAFYQGEIQSILLRQRTPRDGLARIATEVRKLKREWVA
jgi:ABC-type glycerol-3-phosphate transport system substrate-binding protein